MRDLAEYERLARKLSGFSRYTAGRVSVAGWELEFVDAPALLSSFETIVVKRWNDFVPWSDEPFIIDCGANIGISVLHYKRLFERARIVAFEPDPRICSALRRNLRANGADDVTVIEAAVWNSNGRHAFWSEGADASRLVAPTGPDSPSTAVDTVRLSDYLSGDSVDFVKVDIEGAEFVAVPDCADALRNVASMVIECHVRNSRPGELSTLLETLAGAEFSVSVNSYGRWVDLSHWPNDDDLSSHYDQLLLVCAWRPAEQRKAHAASS